jgi:hypothetical protein
MSDNADCTTPIVQAIPELQPVVFSKPVNTYAALVLWEVARRVILTTTRLRRDQTTRKSISYVSAKREYYIRAALFHQSRIRVPYRLATVVNIMMAAKMR